MAKDRGEVMKRCPDCKKEGMLPVGSSYVDLKGDGVGYEEKVYKCLNCGLEFEESELDDF